VRRLDVTRDFDFGDAGCPSTGGNIVDAVRAFIDQARNGEVELREFMLVSGMRPADRTLAHSWHGRVSQYGATLTGVRYFFHGIGCRIELPGQAATDIDWTFDGEMILGAHHVNQWMAAVGVAGVDVDAVVAAFETMGVNGELARESPTRYIVVDPR
jgi:hypothetical protein